MGRLKRLTDTLIDVRNRHDGDKRIVLVQGRPNVYMLSPEASRLLPELLKEYGAQPVMPAARGTVITVVGDDEGGSTSR